MHERVRRTTLVDAFIESKKGEGLFILKAASLEAYLPDGHGRKDMDKLITLRADDDFETKLRAPQREELFAIVDHIEGLRRAI